MATLDHVTPVCEGGKKDPDNLIASCLLCNQLKSGEPTWSLDEARLLVQRTSPKTPYLKKTLFL